MIRQQTTRPDHRIMKKQVEQLAFALAGLDQNTTLSGEFGRGHNGSANKLDVQDRAFHDWYRFVLSYPPADKRLLLKLTPARVVSWYSTYHPPS